MMDVVSGLRIRIRPRSPTTFTSEHKRTSIDSWRRFVPWGFFDKMVPGSTAVFNFSYFCIFLRVFLLAGSILKVVLRGEIRISLEGSWSSDGLDDSSDVTRSSCVRRQQSGLCCLSCVYVVVVGEVDNDDDDDDVVCPSPRAAPSDICLRGMA